MVLEINNRKRIAVGGQGYRTAIRNKAGRVEFSCGLLPSLNIRSSVDAMSRKRIVSVNMKWLVWGVEVYAYALDGIKREG